MRFRALLIGFFQIFVNEKGVVINHPSNKHFIGSTVLRAEIGKPPRLEVIRNTRLSKLLK